MQKNGKFYLGLSLLTAILLLCIPLWFGEIPVKNDIPADAQVQPAPATTTTVAATTTAAKTTDLTAAPQSAVEALKKDSFTVLHADGKKSSGISCRDFLIYTLAAEMYPTFEVEALKAQAVAAYTYFCYQREREAASPTKALNGADFADTPAPYPEGYTDEYWEKKWGADVYAEHYQKLAAAVDSVAGVCITYNQKPIFAAYHAISNGQTELPEVVWSGAFPYLQSVDSAADVDAPKYETEVRFTTEKFKEALASVKGIDFSASPAKWIEGEPTRSAAGTVLRLTVGGVALTGRECRTLFGLRSSCFSVAYKDGGFTFTVQGYGHGVGMSQYGAQFLAQKGYSYAEILHHYYTDVELSQMF